MVDRKSDAHMLANSCLCSSRAIFWYPLYSWQVVSWSRIALIFFLAFSLFFLVVVVVFFLNCDKVYVTFSSVFIAQLYSQFNKAWVLVALENGAHILQLWGTFKLKDSRIQLTYSKLKKCKLVCFDFFFKVSADTVTALVLGFYLLCTQILMVTLQSLCHQVCQLVLFYFLW